MIKINSKEKRSLRCLGTFIELASKQDPILVLAKSKFVDGLRDKDICGENLELLLQYCNEPALLKFRNYLRDLEINQNM